MDRTTLLKLLKDGWSEGLWAASWRQSVEGLTPEQAAWKPAKGRHSIWQIVRHMVFWREEALRRYSGQPKTPDDQIMAQNFPEPTEVSESAWKADVERLHESQKRVEAYVADPTSNVERIGGLIGHDCYHTGQINMIRAMQGLKPIE